MTQWAKIKFFHQNLLGQTGSVLTATSTDPGDYSVDYLYDTLEGYKWKAANAADPCYIMLDLPAAACTAADYLGLSGHNLGSINATITLQYSDDGAVYTNAFTPVQAVNDGVFLKEFASPGSRRYWRLKLTGHNGIPEIAICMWGLTTELNYASMEFDPHSEEARANINISDTGYLLGIHLKYMERELSLAFNTVRLDQGTRYFADGTYTANGTITAKGADIITLYDKLRHWRKNSGLRNFLVAWETANSPGDVFLMRPDVKFSNPLNRGGLYRNVTITLKGRKE